MRGSALQLLTPAACMQIVATVLVWEHCWYFMPSAADEDPVLQVSKCSPQRGVCWHLRRQPFAPVLVSRWAQHGLSVISCMLPAKAVSA